MVRDILQGMYGDVADIIMGYSEAETCEEYEPTNVREVSRMLYNVMAIGGTMVIHADIDMDGFGSAYVLQKFVKSLSNKVNVVTTCNTQKVHGITQEYVDYINSNAESIDLLVIVDSSTNDIGLIKQIKCDVAVIDHHEVTIEQTELIGATAGGKYSICTNMLGSEYDSRLSGCAVVYYVVRFICKVLRIDLESLNLLLEQWVGITMISDVIPLATKRGQYFIHRLYHDTCVESTIYAMMKSLNIEKIDKNLIAYKIAPLINSAIRCGASLLALKYVLTEPEKINELEKYKEYQRKLVRLTCTGVTAQDDNLVSLDLSNVGIPKNIVRNYCGVIAAQMVSLHNKTAYVYIKENGICRGSVRGLSPNIDYRKMCIDAGLDARGHKAAFGLDIIEDNYSKLSLAVGNADKVSERFISVGQINGGIKHIESIQQLKKDGNLLLLATANSRLSSNETVEIHLQLDNIEHTSRGAGIVYEYEGLELLAFEELIDDRATIYPELNNFGVTLYVNKLKEG